LFDKHINRVITIDTELTKTEPFADHRNRVADLARAFAHPARVAILQLLVERNAKALGYANVEYGDIVAVAGFADIQIQKQKAVTLPDQLLRNYLTPDELKTYQQDGRGIFSITVFTTKFAAKSTGQPE